MVEVEINIRKSPQENAEEYFEEAKKAKEKIRATKKALEETLKRIDNLGTDNIEKREIEIPKRKKRGKWFEAYRWMITSDGFLVIGGKDKRQNEIIFSKRFEQKDIVLHADIQGAPLTVIKSESKEITPLAIREAAEFAAAFSSGWKKGLGGVDVYWIRPEQVSKTPPTGQFLPKGSFMIHGQKNFLKKMELRLSVGIKLEKDKENNRIAKVISGNVQSVNKHTKYFVTIIPGDSQQQELANKIKTRILQKVLPEDKSLIERVSAEDIQRMIPSGSGDIIG